MWCKCSALITITVPSAGVVIDTRDVIYFVSIVGVFVAMTVTALERR